MQIAWYAIGAANIVLGVLLFFKKLIPNKVIIVLNDKDLLIWSVLSGVSKLLFAVFCIGQGLFVSIKTSLTVIGFIAGAVSIAIELFLILKFRRVFK